jgi:hypothetical protein
MENLKELKNKRTLIHLKMKNEKDEETGEINIEIWWVEFVLEKEEVVKPKEIEKRNEEKKEEEKDENMEKNNLKKKELEKKKEKDGDLENISCLEEEGVDSVNFAKETFIRVLVNNAVFYEKQVRYRAYVSVVFSNQEFKTKVVNNTKTAIYNESVVFFIC